MIAGRPFITDSYMHFLGERIKRALFLAVRLIDAFTGEILTRHVRVSLKEFPEIIPIINISDYVCFSGILKDDQEEFIIEPGLYTLKVELTPMQRNTYFLAIKNEQEEFVIQEGMEIPISLPKPDPKNPVETIYLSPTPSYNFSEHATLIRGKVFRAENSKPVMRAVVSSVYRAVDPDDFDREIEKTVTTQTNENGEYVLFFKQLETPNQRVLVRAKLEGRPLPPEFPEIEEGRTTKKINFTF